MFTNRHVIVALLVAPVLSVLAWFAVGSLLGEKAAPARAGTAYPLLEQSNCRYASGLCELRNKDVEIALRFVDAAGAALELSASHPLQRAVLSVGDPDADQRPRSMEPRDRDGMHWRLPLDGRPAATDRIRIAVAIGDSNFFAEASTTFLQKVEPVR
jgi:hypothetical protein